MRSEGKGKTRTDFSLNAPTRIHLTTHHETSEELVKLAFSTAT